MSRELRKILCGVPAYSGKSNYSIVRYIGNTCSHANEDIGARYMPTHPMAHLKGQDPRRGFTPMTSQKQFPRMSELLGKVKVIEVNPNMRVDGVEQAQLMGDISVSCPCAQFRCFGSKQTIADFQNNPATNNRAIGERVSRRPVPLNSKCKTCRDYNDGID